MAEGIIKNRAEKLTMADGPKYFCRVKTTYKMKHTEETEENVAAEEPRMPEKSDDDTAAAEPVEMVAKDEVNRLVAEAEARGYLRGKNENAAMSMSTPRLWENPCRTAMDQESLPDPSNGFLSKIRPGVWD